LSKFKLLPP